MKRNEATINLSAWQFAMHIGVTTNKVLAALKANNVEPRGKEKHYTLRDLVRSMMNTSGLKQGAEDARYRKQIAEAQVAENKLAEQEKELSRTEDWREFILDAQTKLFQLVRHSKLSEAEKTLMNHTIKNLGKTDDVTRKDLA